MKKRKNILLILGLIIVSAVAFFIKHLNDMLDFDDSF